MSRARDFSRINTSSPTFDGIVSASALVSTNNLTVDTNTLHVDAVNNRVGVGTISPSTPLHVVSTGTDSSTPSNSNSQLILQDSGGLAGNGGMLLFAASQGGFAAIKGRITDGTNNTAGNLSFYNRSSVSASTLTENMRIDPGGRVTKPLQPYFRAWASTTTANANVINYDSIINNVGGHFNTTNRRFTAPVTGIYYFEAHFLTERTTATGDSGFDFRINGTGTKRVYFGKDGTANMHVEARGTLICFLNPNDFVDIYAYAIGGSSNIIANYSHCQFAGYLLG